MDRRWESPLREIEQAALDRAKAADLDMSATDGVERLRAMLADEAAQWRLAFRRGQRSQDIADPDGAVERALRNLTGYGPLQPLLDDADVWEIMVNGPSSIFAKRHSGPSGYHHEVFHDDDHVVRVLTKILDEASRSHRKLDPAEGLQDAQLDTGARLHIVHSDIGRDGQASDSTYSEVGSSKTDEVRTRRKPSSGSVRVGDFGKVPAQDGC